MLNLLSGIRVIDLTRMLAGPYATMLLADMGAEVIKIEDPVGGDEIRKMGPPFVKGESAYFISVNRNKKSLTLNLKSEDGRALFYKLAEKSDVVVDNFRPGVIEKLRIDYKTLKSHNPKIICCSLTSFGDEGPLKDQPAFDLIVQAYSGALSITGSGKGEPARLGIPMGDLAGGSYVASAVAAALLRRQTTGEGCRIDVSLLDALSSLLTYVAQYYFTDGKVPLPQGSRHMSCVPYGAFKTRDIHIVIGVFTEKFWAGFCRAIGHDEFILDPRFKTNELRVRNRDALEPMLEKMFKEHEGDEWLKRLSHEGVPAGPVKTVDKTLAMEQMHLRGMVLEMNHPVAGKQKTLGYPIKVNGAIDRDIIPSPLLGEQTKDILTSIAGLTPEDIQQLKQKGVV